VRAERATPALQEEFCARLHQHRKIVFKVANVYGLLLIVLGARTIHLINRIDYSAPIVTIQKQLARLRGFYIRCGMTIGIAWWLLWIPFMTMVLGFAGVDVIRSAPGMVVAGTLGGIAGLLLTLWFHHWSRRRDRPRLARFMNESVTGTSLLSAQAFIDELAEFEKES